jgi:hypothetical protein
MMEAVATNYLPLTYAYTPRYGEGRISLPVVPSQLLYANFQYVSGVPAQAGSAAYSVDKLHILDVLISRLESVRSQPLAAKEASDSLTSARVDALISQYGSEIHSLVTASTLPYVKGPAVEPGSLFSLAA